MQDWLFSSGDCAWPHDFAVRERAAFRHGAVSAYLEETPVLPGIWLYRGEARGRSRFSIDVAGGQDKAGRIVLGSMLAGRGEMTLEGRSGQNWREDGRAYAVSPIERSMRYDIQSENGWRTIAVRLEEEALDIVGRDGALPKVVRNVLEGRVDDLIDLAPIAGSVRAVSNMLMVSPYEGAMQGLFRQAKVLELLAHYFDLLGRDRPEDDALSGPEQRRVREARERLLADLRNPPDLAGLADAVGMTPRRLNRHFRALYGTTVFDYLRDARLDAARQALEAGTALPLKQLAWELGYNQSSNFVTAFRRRFGMSPAAYRRVRDVR